MLFTKKDIERYYDLSEIHYRLHWNLDKSRSLHYGYWDASTKNFHEALLKINEVMAEKARITKNDAVLDAGCGVGGSSLWLAKEIGCRVTGISLSERQINKANATAAAEGLSGIANFERRDYTDTGYPDGSFDVIWGIESICYAPDKSLFLKEAFRLLKKGGRLIVVDIFRKEGLAGKDDKLMTRLSHGWAIEEHSTIESFKTKMKDEGFTNINSEDISKNIIRSVKRLYKAYFLGIIPAIIYRITHPRATDLAKNNVDTAYVQYKSLKKGLWRYLMVMGEKDV